LGAILALDFAIRHSDKVASLVLIGVQYKVPTLLIDFQNFLFRCMPKNSFDSIGLSKRSMIELTHSMRSLDFTSQISEISCPVTIVCGEKDYANLKASKKLKELLPQSSLYIIPNVGHEINKEAPNAIAEILN
jgi:pimeloyl-ACP methyl ester carboxylesterase